MLALPSIDRPNKDVYTLVKKVNAKHATTWDDANVTVFWCVGVTK